MSTEPTDDPQFYVLTTNGFEFIFRIGIVILLSSFSFVILMLDLFDLSFEIMRLLDLSIKSAFCFYFIITIPNLI
jgi:hypothetical protein